MRFAQRSLFLTTALATLATTARAQVAGQAKITGASLGIAGDAHFGRAVTPLGDLDGDGVIDLAVGAPRTDEYVPNFDTGSGAGELAVLLMNADASVKTHVAVKSGVGGFAGMLTPQNAFGYDADDLGDFDGDGVRDLVVGAPLQGPTQQGSVFLLLMNADGTVKDHVEILGSELYGTDVGTRFGVGVASLGDVNGDGTTDIAAGGGLYMDVWVLLLQSDGTIGSSQLHFVNFDVFPQWCDSLAGVGDVSGDGVPDLGVGLWGQGAFGEDVLAAFRVLLLDVDASALGTRSYGSVGTPVDSDFGSGLDRLDGFSSGGGVDYVVGDQLRDEVRLIATDPTGLLAHTCTIATGTGGLQGTATGRFGYDVAHVGDLDGSGSNWIAVGAPVAASGEVWLLRLVDSLAASSVHDGSGANPVTLTAQTEPILGASWLLDVDTSAVPGALATTATIGMGGPVQGVFLHGLFQGELLMLPPYYGDVAFQSHAIGLPDDCTLLGRTATVQASIFAGGHFALQNALNVRFGL